jgi:arylsulfatase
LDWKILFPTTFSIFTSSPPPADCEVHTVMAVKLNVAPRGGGAAAAAASAVGGGVKNVTTAETSSNKTIWYISLVLFVALIFSQLVNSSKYFQSFQSVTVESLFSNPGVEENAVYNDELGPLNVVVFFPDDWRWDAIQDEKPGVVYTPFLTALAKDGIRFANNAVTSSICWISRATLFTGRYVSQHNSARLFCPVFTLPSMWEYSWVATLQRYGGYFVGHIGKWQYHNRNVAGLFNFSYLHEGSHWYKVGGERIHANDRARNDAIAFLRARPVDRNFAMTVAFYPPKPLGDSSEPGAQWEPAERFEALYENHTFVQPYNYSEAYAYVPQFISDYSPHRYSTRFRTSEMYQESMKHYYALVTHVDEACRDIVAELELQGVLNRTMIIVSADNGMMLGAHGMGGKWHPYQESIKVPLIVYDPRMAKSKRGKVDLSHTLNIDLAATIISAANLTVDPRIQGRDISDIYIRRKQQDGSGDGKFGIETKPWREDYYYEFPLGEFPASTALVNRQYKYIRWQGRDTEQIFDLLNDPYELHDLMTAQPPLHLLQQVGTEFRPVNVTDMLAEFRARHDVLEAEAKAPFPGDEVIPCARGLAYP